MNNGTHFLVTVSSEDQQGLIAAISRALFELDINLGDASYNVLGRGGRFVALCLAPASMDGGRIRDALRATPVLDAAQVEVVPFDLPVRHRDEGIAVRVVFSGRDMPGLVAQITELAQDFSANIEQMQTRVVQGEAGDAYRIEMVLTVPEARREALLSALQNVASGLGLDFRTGTEPAV